jgi:hypothetical protein
MQNRKVKKKQTRRERTGHKHRQILLPLSLGHRIKTMSKKMWALIGGAAVLVTLSGGLALFPRISVSSAASLEPHNPFATVFIISNDGYFSIHDATFRCVILNAEDESHARVIAPQGIQPTNLNIPEIGAGEKSTHACPWPFKFETPMLSADLIFLVSYRPSLIPWRQEKAFRFGTAKNKDGQLIWLPRSKSE